MQSARGYEYGVKHIISPQAGPLTDVLLSISDIDSEQTAELLNLGSIYLNGQRLQDPQSIVVGDYLRIHTKPRRFPKNDGLWQQRVLFQNEYFVVINKPSGLPVHATVDNTQENVQAYVEQTLGQKVFLTHRLDVPTRGLIVYAKSALFQSAFNKMLIAREMKKIYRAKVNGPPPPLGMLTHYMEVSPRAPKKVSREALPGWQECVLEVLATELLPSGVHQLKIQLHTGRTHQIRAQLACEGCPIVEDHAYGSEKISEDEQIELEACELEFCNPLSGEKHLFSLLR